MSKKKEIETLKDNNRFLQNRVSGLEQTNRIYNLRIEELEASLKEVEKAYDEKYAGLLERYITMLERTARINEQREAD